MLRLLLLVLSLVLVALYVTRLASYYVLSITTISRKASPIPESLVLHIDQLSRNVNENHLKEIFGMLN